MRYAIMSDVHANPEALKAALADARGQGAEKVVCLGDVVGYGPDPAGAVEMCRRECDVVLMGNHDAAVAGVIGIDNFIPTAQRGVRRHFAELSEKDRAWLRSLPYLYKGRTCLCAHGTPMRPECFFYIHDMGMPTATLYTMDEVKRAITFVGHTHHALWVLQKPGVPLGVYSADKGFSMKRGERYIVNVGAVGYPRADGDITYVIYDTTKRRVDFRHLPFDYCAYVADMIAKNIPLPDWLLEYLNEKMK